MLSAAADIVGGAGSNGGSGGVCAKAEGASAPNASAARHFVVRAKLGVAIAVFMMSSLAPCASSIQRPHSSDVHGAIGIYGCVDATRPRIFARARHAFRDSALAPSRVLEQPFEPHT